MIRPSYLLDTNTLSDLIRHPSGSTRDRIAERGADRVCTSIVVTSELRFGAANGNGQGHLKQEQLGRAIDPGDLEDQRRRVMHHSAVHQVNGVDLNPAAVELGARSLWLATIHRLKLRDGENGAPDLYRACATHFCKAIGGLW